MYDDPWCAIDGSSSPLDWIRPLARAGNPEGQRRKLSGDTGGGARAVGQAVGQDCAAALRTQGDDSQYRGSLTLQQYAACGNIIFYAKCCLDGASDARTIPLDMKQRWLCQLIEAGCPASTLALVRYAIT